MARGKGASKHGLQAEFTALALIGANHPASSSTCKTPTLPDKFKLPEKFKSLEEYFSSLRILCLEESRAAIRGAFSNPNTRQLRRESSNNSCNSSDGSPQPVGRKWQPTNPHGESVRIDDWTIKRTAVAALPEGAPHTTHVISASGYPGLLRTWTVVALRWGKLAPESAFVVDGQDRFVGFAHPKWGIDELKNSCIQNIAKHWRGTKHDTSNKDFISALRKQPLYCREICDLNVRSRCYLAACSGASGPVPPFLWDVIGVPRSVHTIFSDSDDDSDAEAAVAVPQVRELLGAKPLPRQESVGSQIGSEVQDGWSDFSDQDDDASDCVWSAGDLFSESRDRDLIAPLNESQQSAVTTFLSGTASGKMQLLQGPPGSGKTHTICRLLQILARNEIFTNGQKKILVCATSNKAVQVVVETLSSADPSIRSVLAGVEEKLQPACRSVFLNTRARVLEEALQSPDRLTIVRALKAFKNAAPATFNQLQFASKLLHAEHADEFESVLQKVREAVAELAYQESRGQAGFLERELLERASIVFCTVASSGRSVLRRTLKNKIECLIVDEAAQGPECETIIPLAYQPQRVLLVGDPQQLSTTVCASRAAELAGYGRSMMQRLFDIKYAHSMLAVQYRMNSEISSFPAKRFYDGLSDGPQTWTLSDTLPAYRLIDVCDGIEERGGRSGPSMSNRLEAETLTIAANALLDFCQRRCQDDSCSDGNFSGSGQSIVVITFYAGQKSLLRRLLPGSIQVHTVDSFQGSEADVVLLSCVRANKQAKVGFLNDFRRLNVALTRAKKCCWVFANCATLRNNDDANLMALWQDASSRKTIWTVPDMQQCLRDEENALSKRRKI